MLFHILRPLANIATRQFFRRIDVTGAEVVSDTPVLYVANHPNVMMDGVLVLGLVPRNIWFLAKSTIFRGRFISRFLDWCHFVPVYRRQDNPEEMTKNEGMFDRVAKTLRANKAVLIFPEGISLGLRKLMPVKTGAARIALQTEAEEDFNVGLSVQPIGITYSDFHRFKSSVTIVVGKPIQIKDYKEAYDKDPAHAVKELSKEIEQRLKKITVQILDDDQAGLVEKIAKLYRSKGYGAHDQERLIAVAAHVKKLLPLYPEKAKEIENKITLYLQLSSSLNLDGSEKLRTASMKVFLVLITPFVLVGVLSHLVPYRLTGFLAKKTAKERQKLASWQLSLGFFLFPLWYIALFFIIFYFFPHLKLALAIEAVLIFCGYLASRYLNEVSLLILATLWPGRKTPLDVLRLMRDEIIEELEEFRKLYKAED